MADDVKLSDLPAAGAIGGTEPIPVVQGGVTKRTTPAALLTYVSAELAASATTDTTDASNITSGTLAKARLPALAVTDISGAEAVAHKGANSGYAPLDSSAKVPLVNLPAAITGALNYVGTWDATANSPLLASGVGTKGAFYKVATAGATDLDGITQWNVGDSAVFDGATWDKLDGIASEVVSVAGKTGVVTLAAGDVSGLAASATTDTTDADNITSGTLAKARLPALVAGDISGLAAVATSGAYADLSGKPSIPAAANPTATVGSSAVNGSASTFMRSDAAPALSPGAQASLAKADTATQPGDLATVATTGAYADLTGKPTIPTGANPTAQVSTAGATNGSASTFMRSDAAPALSAGVITSLGKADTAEQVANKGANSGYAPLDSSAKVPLANLPASIQGGLNYQGAWNANTNSPTLVSSTGTKGFYYKVSVAGATSIDGISQWNVGDSIVFDGTTWDKLDGISSEVVSVAGKTGVVTLASGDVSGLAASATTDTTNAANISSGTLLAARMPALTGDVTTVAGAVAATIAQGAVTDDKAAVATKPSLTVVATTNLVLSGAQTIDGLLTTAGTSVVLATAQTTGSQNGPWVVRAGAWTRPAWYPNGGTTQANGYATVQVRQGGTYQGTTWKLTTAAPITIDTTATTWAQLPLALNASSVTGALPPANGGFIVTDVQQLTSSGTWTKPPTINGNAPKFTRVMLVGAGGSGGGGLAIASGTACCGGSGGGAGFINLADFPTSVLGSTETVTLGAGGTAAAAGASGNGGGQSSFGSWLQAFGGGGGSVGQSAANGGGGGSGGSRGAGGNATTATQGTAGSIGGVAGNSTAPNYYQSSGGGSGINAGQGSGSPNFSAIQGCTGGGSGAGLAAVPVALSAGNGGFCQGGSANNQGITPGGNGTNAVASVNLFLGSQGGGGGASNIGAGAGGQGGTGINGSGGGGGGSALTTGTAGAGGKGGDGFFIAVTFY